MIQRLAVAYAQRTSVVSRPIPMKAWT